jgi:glycosyltransferase involved in cell wall biosynthesis
LGILASRCTAEIKPVKRLAESSENAEKFTLDGMICENIAMRTFERVKEGRRSLAVLCPVFNEQQTIPLFFERIAGVFDRIQDKYEPRLYFIDNGCIDGSLKIIRDLHERFPNVFVIVLSRNFGYQCALETALRVAAADLYMMIDVDCEDPPDMLIDFLRFQDQGYDIVYGERVDRPESAGLKAMRYMFYRISHGVADDNFVLDMAEFSLITAEVRNAIIQDSTSFPFLRASIGRIGFLRKAVPYKRSARIAGVTHYNFFGMAVFAVAGILSASTLALRIPAYLFPVWAVVMTAIAIIAVASPAQWQIPTLIATGFLFVGFSVTIIGLYVARIYKNGLNRPNAIVRYGLSILPSDELKE